jgi:ankyrin repeat protein
VRAYAASLAAAVGDGDDAADDDVEAAAPGTADDVLEDAVSQALEDALSVAAERGNVAAVEALVAAFGRLDDGRERRAKRVTPLARAAAAGQAAAAGALVRSGARPTAVDELGRAPLHRAAAGLDAGHAACVDVLLDAGAPLALRDRAEQSALHAAARSGSAAATRALLRRDGAAACANWLDRWGRPPLAWVALRDDDDESLAVADALLRGGADPAPCVLRPGVLRRKTNLAPESPLAIADRRGKTALVALLTAAAAATPPRPPK